MDLEAAAPARSTASDAEALFARILLALAGAEAIPAAPAVDAIISAAEQRSRGEHS